jgi:hypothetical protein
MNELSVVDRADWRRLKALILDSVSQPEKAGFSSKAKIG